MNCPVQDFLRNGGTLEELTEKYAIKIKRHSVYPNLCQAKYNQILSPMGDPIVQSCRGIILDEADNWRIIARPFDKFFNEGEGHAAPIDWESARVLEKLDGSLAIVYYYKGDWHMATSGTPDASGPVGDQQKTFKDLFWDTFRAMDYDARWFHPAFTYMFELMTPENRVVVPHAESKLVLIGVRLTETGEEMDIHNEEDQQMMAADGVTWKIVRSFKITSSEDVQASFGSMDGLRQEGYVVVDRDFHRIKIKHPQYVVYHHLVGSLTKKKVLDAVRHGESPEILTYFPTWKKEFDEMGQRLDELVRNYEDLYDRVQGIENQKEFAIAVQQFKVPTAPFFAVRKSNLKPIPIPAGVVLSSKRKVEEAPTPISFREYFADLRIESLVSMLGLKEEEVTDEVPGAATSPTRFTC